MSVELFVVGHAAPPKGDPRPSILLLDKTVHELVLMGEPFRPEPIRFGVVSEKRLEMESDFPSNALVWPVMSERMFGLCSGEFDYSSHPVVVEEDGEFVASSNGDGYVLCQLPTVDAVDWAASEWRRTGQVIVDDEFGLMDTLVLREEVALPPLFKLEGFAATFTSRQGRDLIDRERLCGPEFSVRTSAGRSFVIPGRI